MNNCGNCKWLTGGVGPHHRKNDGTMKQRYRYIVFSCSVPFDPPKAVPACFSVKVQERRMMAPYYGEGCPFHSPFDIEERK